MRGRRTTLRGVVATFVLTVATVFTGAAMASAAAAAPLAPASLPDLGGTVVVPWTSQEFVTLVFGAIVATNPMMDLVRIAVDDGPYGDWQPLTPEASVQLPPVEGAHAIHVQLASDLLDPGEYGSVDDPLQLDLPTTLDATGPATTVAGGVVAGPKSKATVRFTVTDEPSPSAAARLSVGDTHGRVVRDASLGTVATGEAVEQRVVLHLPRGRCRVTVLATCLAGNPQRRAGSGTLIVR